uniref:Large ribosomal subunit protein mL49 n=1 Tax=Chromera velia CCMP2878 TaxID=1169474 RepID=A0A0G4F2U7_9ALVE|eukprot:Cvel_14785.t1-p1 / transcript=Cvel_14785.t1 / gene=Cvel_14785 / organism=Chromera_velia_CCMP2878 / gene_product=hypothetical protein / transcript_product=hypothetical protein / location=Cvel_scaffold1065:3994-7104(-) / protein_length=240 / sequence_SO=supercontig / SO=protein_coding / is_pseudo=false
MRPAVSLQAGKLMAFRRVGETFRDAERPQRLVHRRAVAVVSSTSSSSSCFGDAKDAPIKRGEGRERSDARGMPGLYPQLNEEKPRAAEFLGLSHRLRTASPPPPARQRGAPRLALLEGFPSVSLSSPPVVSSLCCLSGGRVRTILQRKFAMKPASQRPDTSQSPWKVVRSQSGNLPVYSRIMSNGTKVNTVVRGIFGDVSNFKKELMNVCEAPVRSKANGVEVEGLHVKKVKQWLQTLGY